MKGVKLNKKLLITAIVILAGVALIPLIYSTTYVASVWDVYGNTDKLPVAVVNSDEGADYDGKRVNFGDDVTEALSKNNQLKWEFTDAQTAKKGLETDNKYYAVITIPEDFSKDLTSAATQTKTQAVVTYSANEKRNYVASMILKSAMLSLKDKMKSKEASKITDKLIKELNSVPDSLETVNDGVKQLGEGAGQLSDGYNKLIDGNDGITSNLDILSEGLNTADSGAKQLNEGAQRLPELVSGSNQLKDGAASLAESSPKITEGIEKVSAGLNTLQTGVSTGIENGKQALSQKLYPAVSDGVTSGINTALASLLPEVESGISRTSENINAAVDSGVKEATNTALGTESDAARGLLEYTSAVESYIAGSKNYIDFPSNVYTYTEGVESYIQNTDKLIALVLAGDTDNAKMLATGLSQSSPALLQGTQALKQGAGRLSEANVSLTEGGDKITARAQTINAIPSAVKAALDEKLVSGLQTGIKDGLEGQLSPALQKGISDGLLNELAPQLSAALASGIEAEVTSSLDTITAQVGDGIGQIQTGITGVNGSGVQADGVSPALLSGAQSLSAGSKALADGAYALANGAGSLTQLQDGVTQLSDGVSRLSEGAGQLSEGSKQLGDGIKQAADGNTELSKGIDKLETGIDEAVLSARQDLRLTDDLPEFIEEDIEVESEPFDHVNNYGESFAPYFFNVSLWTGALISMMTLFFDFKRRLKLLGPNSERPVIRFLIYMAIAAAQAILCGVAAHAGLGLKVSNPALYYIGLLAIALTYTFIIEFLMRAFGDIGKMLSMILMVLQLTATGGTFPLELNPGFFRAVNPFLPMSYGIQLMKEAVSGSNPGYGVKNMFILLSFGAAALIGLQIVDLVKYHRKKKEKTVIPPESLSEVLR